MELPLSVLSFRNWPASYVVELIAQSPIMLLIFKMPARDTTWWLDVKGRRRLHGRSVAQALWLL